MPKERELVNVITTGSPHIRTKAEIDAEQAERAAEPNTFADVEMSLEEIEGRKKIAAFFSLPEKERKARRAEILDRGILFDRLNVPIPPDLYGEWARNDALYMDHMRGLGFWVDTTYATKRALHSDGSSSNIVGDVIYMVTTKENKKLIEQVRQEQTIREHRSPKQAREEAEGRDAVPREIPTFSESTSRTVSASEIKDVLNRANVQTTVQRG